MDIVDNHKARASKFGDGTMKLTSFVDLKYFVDYQNYVSTGPMAEKSGSKAFGTRLVETRYCR